MLVTHSMQAHLVFLGISEVVGVVCSVRDRREYELVVRVRFTGAEADARTVSSSELPSGAARFFPLGSLGGSFIVSGAEAG